MNEIINWIALNNTLMIRTGFTAILVLVVIYMYRFFFVVKVNTVEAARSMKEVPAAEAGAAAEENAALLKSKNEEIEKMRSDLEKLGARLNESEGQVATLKNLTRSAAADEGGGAAAGETKSGDSDLVATLNAQLDQLRSRLTEYEIIAEDISEIGQLREENAALKKKLDAPEAAPEAGTPKPSAPAPDVRLVSEKEVNATEKQLLNQFEEISVKKGS